MLISEKDMGAGTSRRKPRIGRPPGPKTVRVVALLYPQQKRDLESLSAQMEGNPPVVRLLREAVKQYLDRKLQSVAFAPSKRGLRVIR